jgi:hypothetical protein
VASFCEAGYLEKDQYLCRITDDVVDDPPESTAGETTSVDATRGSGISKLDVAEGLRSKGGLSGPDGKWKSLPGIGVLDSGNLASFD